MSSYVDFYDDASDANQRPPKHTIAFTVTALDDTTTTFSPDREQEISSHYCEGDHQPKQHETPGMCISNSTVDTHRQSAPTRPFIFKGEDEEIVFNDIDEDPWKHFISSPDNISDGISAGTPGASDHDDEDENYWVEFEHEGESPWEANEQDNPAFLDTDADSISDPESDDSDEDEIDLPLSHFQPLPIGPFAHTDDTIPTTPTSTTPTNHPHPFPKITPDPATNTITINFDTEPNYECVGFQLARYVAQMANVPLPLSRRVHELQGWIEEDRRGGREWRAYRREWMMSWGSPLWESWEVDGEEEDQGDSAEEERSEEDEEDERSD